MVRHISTNLSVVSTNLFLECMMSQFSNQFSDSTFKLFKYVSMPFLCCGLRLYCIANLVSLYCIDLYRCVTNFLFICKTVYMLYFTQSFNDLCRHRDRYATAAGDHSTADRTHLGPIATTRTIQKSYDLVCLWLYISQN